MFSGVQPTAIFMDTPARYVLIEITKCNQYSEAAKWTAASIYELAVYGNPVETAVTENVFVPVPIQTACGRDESYAVELDGEWLFGGRDLAPKFALAADRSNWQKVTIPRTWNAKDGADGGNNYLRAAFWYHKEFTLDEDMIGKNIYIEFLGANTQTHVYVNGELVSPPHRGGYTAFRYNITDWLQEGTNVLDVRVDNTPIQSIAPLSGDFSLYGGIYRRVYLIAVDDVHVDLKNYGSSGLFLTTGSMRGKTAPEDLGKFNVKADIVNEANEDKTVTVVVTIIGDKCPNRL